MLTDYLIENGWLKTTAIIEAFRKINRADFLAPGSEKWAEANQSLPIGFGQTISQPLVVAFMLELLEPEPGQKILDIGSGSCWTTALLAEIAAKKEGGKVIGLEIIPELKEFGENNLNKYGFIENGTAKNILADANKGYPDGASYDRILASASAKSIPKQWKEQLKINGRIVASVGNSIYLLIKKGENDFEQQEFPGFAFVPLVSKKFRD